MLARPASVAVAPPPRPSRAASVAEIHLASINASRKHCGLAPLTATELAHEFADIERTPPRTAPPQTRRDAANLVAARQGAPTSSAEIDAMWTSIAAGLNATLPVTRGPIGSPRASVARSSGKPTPAETDGMWTSIAAGLNAEAGLRPPARASVR